MITEATLDSVLKDRQGIVDHYIKKTDNGLGAITAFAALVFYEDGWDWDVVRVINGPPQFFVKSFDMRAYNESR